MPSLHFGYSFVIGLTIATMPNSRSLHTNKLRRAMLIIVGMSYPLLILTAIVSTANHYILDAVAGFFVSIIAWNINWVLLNLLPIEDFFFNLLHIHKPTQEGEVNSGNVSPLPTTRESEEHDWWRQA